MKIISPVASPKNLKRETTKLLSLKGKNIGLFDNGWPSWTFIITEMEKIFKTEYEVNTVTKWSIPISSPPSDDLIEEASEASDICIVGLGN